jgi:hypothetical protein
MANPFKRRTSVLAPSSPAPGSGVAITGVLSPWATAQLGSVIIGEGLVEAAGAGPLSIEQALQVPAMAKAYSLLVASLGPIPLVALDATGKLEEQPTFLYRSDTGVSPYNRQVATLRSLFFFGYALWAVKRGAAGQIVDASWIPDDQWKYENERVTYRAADGSWHPVTDPRSVILFEHPLGGILNTARRTILSSLLIEEDIVRKLRNPIPLTALRNNRPLNESSELAPDEIKALLKTWTDQRRNPEGALAYLPQGIVLEVFGEVNPALYIEARNAVRTDVANFTGIPTSLLDGSLSEASLTYTTTEGNRSRFIDETVPLWLDPITMRLSQDDVVPRGQRVRADLTDRLSATPSPTGPVTED